MQTLIERRWFDAIAQWCVIALVFFLPLSTALTDIFFVSAFFCTLIAGELRSKFYLIIRTRILTTMLIFYGLVIIGAFYSVGEWSTRLILLKKYSHLLLGVTILPLMLNEKHRRYALFAFLLAIAIALVMLYLGRIGIVMHSLHHDSYSEVFKSHIETSYLMSFAAYLLAVFAMQYPRYRVPFCFGALLIIGYVFLFSTSRTGYVVFSALFILFAWQFFHWRYFLLFLLTLLLMFVLAYFSSSVPRSTLLKTKMGIEHYFYHPEDSKVNPAGVRIEFYRNSIQIIKKHPVLGTGTGSFYHQYALLSPKPKSGIITGDPANEYLNIGVQYGVLGLLIMLWMFVAHWKGSFDLPKPYSYIAQAVVVSFAVGCLFNSWLKSTTEGHFYSVFVPLLFASFYDYYHHRVLKAQNNLQPVRL